MARAVERGLAVTRPHGDSKSYDVGVEHGGRFSRVQVKSTMFKDRGGYSCSVRGSDGPYQGDPFEYLAAYVFQEDLWYIIPAEIVVGQGSIALYPRLKNAKYGPYREAWHLLRQGERSPTRVDRIEASAEEAERFSWGEWFWGLLRGEG